MGSLEKIVEGGFRALLICSAIYFGAKYSPYVLKIADNIKEKIMHGSYTSTSGQAPRSREPPQSLMYSDPRLYNAIMMDNYVEAHSRVMLDSSPIIDEK